MPTHKLTFHLEKVPNDRVVQQITRDGESDQTYVCDQLEKGKPQACALAIRPEQLQMLVVTATGQVTVKFLPLAAGKKPTLLELSIGPDNPLIWWQGSHFDCPLKYASLQAEVTCHDEQPARATFHVLHAGAQK